jgi:hypothetical protein
MPAGGTDYGPLRANGTAMHDARKGLRRVVLRVSSTGSVLRESA